MWLLLQMLHPIIGLFIFISSSFSGTWSATIHKVHIALQELQVVALVLHGMAFPLLCKVVAVHFYNRTAKAYVCNQEWYSISTFQTTLPLIESC